MDYQPINLKHIRTEVFKLSQEQFSEVLEISTRTYQKYEEGDIPHKKIDKLRSLIAEYAKNNNIDFDFSEVPSMEETGKMSLDEFDDMEILNHIAKHSTRFKAIPSFKFIVGMPELEILEEKIKLLESRLNK